MRIMIVFSGSWWRALRRLREGRGGVSWLGIRCGAIGHLGVSLPLGWRGLVNPLGKDARLVGRLGCWLGKECALQGRVAFWMGGEVASLEWKPVLYSFLVRCCCVFFLAGGSGCKVSGRGCFFVL